ncbi:MAG: ABC transporter permease subunit, partial [Archaeoglobaceae archaeon]
MTFPVFRYPCSLCAVPLQFFGKDVIDTLLELPMIVSPVALGAMILILSNTPLGMTIRNTGVEFVFTIYGIFLAQFATTAGIAVRLIKATMDEIPTRYEDAAKTLGASPIKVFFTIAIPLSKNGIMAAAILT